MPVVCTAWSTVGLRSASSTLAPASPSRRAHSSPASPAPTTSTSTPALIDMPPVLSSTDPDPVRPARLHIADAAVSLSVDQLAIGGDAYAGHVRTSVGQRT